MLAGWGAPHKNYTGTTQILNIADLTERAGSICGGYFNCIIPFR